MKIDKNYLNHNFISNVQLNQNKYVCAKCNISIKYRNGIYTYCVVLPKPPAFIGVYEVLNITCEETIIKNLLE